MYELIRLIKEAIGVRPLIPLILILLSGLTFKTVRGYPVRELFFDRYYLLTVLTMVFGSFAYLIWTSSLAERTPEGRFGVYIARIKDDPTRTIQTRLLEGMAANLLGKASDAKLRLEVRDLKWEIRDQDVENLPEKAVKLNATVIIWGTAIDEKSIYPRLWSQQGGLARTKEPLNVSEISPLAEYASQAWDRVEKAHQLQLGLAEYKSEAQLGQELAALRAEVAELRDRVLAGLTAGLEVGKPITEKLTAVLVGIGDYGGRGDLYGPSNDVVALRTALLSRNKEWNITTLLNRQVTQNAVEELINSKTSSMPSDETLLLYLSGHVDPDQRNAYKFYLSDMSTSIDVLALITQTLKTHPRTIFLVDGRFDPSSLGADLTKQAAILTAEAEGMAYELNIKGKMQGAFTAGLVDAIRSAMPGTALAVDDAFRFVQASLKRTSPEARPRILLGDNPPTL